MNLYSDTGITLLSIFIAFVVPLIFYRHLEPQHHPIDPLTALFYEVSAHVESVNCTFTYSALQHLPLAYDTTFRPTLTLDPPSPLHRAVYVFIESTLHRWATQCL